MTGFVMADHGVVPPVWRKLPLLGPDVIMASNLIGEAECSSNCWNVFTFSQRQSAETLFFFLYCLFGQNHEPADIEAIPKSPIVIFSVCTQLPFVLFAIPIVHPVTHMVRSA
jgi:hypothetical protein